MNTLPRDSDGKLSAWAWPGGYPIYYLDGHNSVLCPTCADRADKDPDELPQFKPVGAGVHWEGPVMYCEGCNAGIESAYGDPEEEKEARQ